MTTTDARLDRIVDQLRDDPVVLDEVTANGLPEMFDETLHDDIAALPYPAYTVLVDRVPGDGLPENAEDLAALLHHRLGADGLYVIGVDGNVEVIAPGVPDVFAASLSLARYEITQSEDPSEFDPDDPQLVAPAEAHLLLTLAPVVGRDHETPEAAAAIDELGAELFADPAMTATHIDIDTLDWPTRADDTGADWAMIAVALIVGVAVALAVRRFLAWRSARSDEDDAVGPAGDPARVNRLLTELDGLVPPTDATGHAAFEAAMRERDAARALVSSRDRIDQVGALVLAERAHERATRALRGAATDTPASPCFLDPRHAAASHVAPLPGRPASLTVPVCAPCADAVADGRRPATLTVRHRGRMIPYFERDDVWARTGFGSLRDDVADLVLAGSRAGRRTREEVRR